MSPFKRAQRASAKQRHSRGRHARPAIDAVTPAPRWPQIAELPPELASTEYEFPTVTLPVSRPGVGRQVLAELAAEDEPLLPWEQELLDNSVEASPQAEAERAAYVRRLERSIAAVADDDTQPIDLADMVLDPAPQPAHAEGLEAVPVPSLPFLNAGAREPLRNGEQFPHDTIPVDLASAVTDLVDAMRAEGLAAEPVHIHLGATTPPTGSALPAALTSIELELRPQSPVVFDTGVLEELLDAPADPVGAPWPPARREPQTPPMPVRRSRKHPLVFADFDNPFYIDLARTVRDTQAAAHELEAQGDAARGRLADRLGALEAAHQQFITAVAAEEYRGRLAEHIRPLPHRVPGAAMAAIEAAQGVSA